MSEPAFPAAVATALNRLTVPPLPEGFADRLAARIAANDLPEEAIAALPTMPQRRRVFGAGLGWRRGGRIVASVTALGLATATAAASGVFGDPVYVPVVSDALAKANLVDLPTRPERAEAAKPQPKAVSEGAELASPKVDGKTAARDLVRSKWQDPEFRKLPKAERQAVMRDAIHAAIENGDFTRDDLRAATAEARTERVERDQERFKQNLPKREALQQKAKAKIAAERERYQQASPEEQAAMREQRRIIVDKQKRMRELRRQLVDAPPEAKPAIRREIRALRQELAASINNDVSPGEGNAEPAR
jgi:hypothetical protein